MGVSGREGGRVTQGQHKKLLSQLLTCLVCCTCTQCHYVAAFLAPSCFPCSACNLLPTNFPEQAEAEAEAGTEADAATVKRTFSSCCQLVSVRFGFGFASAKEAALPPFPIPLWLLLSTLLVQQTTGRCLCRERERRFGFACGCCA